MKSVTVLILNGSGHSKHITGKSPPRWAGWTPNLAKLTTIGLRLAVLLAVAAHAASVEASRHRKEQNQCSAVRHSHPELSWRRSFLTQDPHEVYCWRNTKLEITSWSVYFVFSRALCHSSSFHCPLTLIELLLTPWLTMLATCSMGVGQ